MFRQHSAHGASTVAQQEPDAWESADAVTLLMAELEADERYEEEKRRRRPPDWTLKPSRTPAPEPAARPAEPPAPPPTVADEPAPTTAKHARNQRPEPQPEPEAVQGEPPLPTSPDGYGQPRAKRTGNLASRKFDWVSELPTRPTVAKSNAALRIGCALPKVLNGKGEMRPYDPDKLMLLAGLKASTFYDGMKALETDGCVQVVGSQRSAGRVLVLMLDGRKITE